MKPFLLPWCGSVSPHPSQWTVGLSNRPDTCLNFKLKHLMSTCTGTLTCGGPRWDEQQAASELRTLIMPQTAHTSSGHNQNQWKPTTRFSNHFLKSGDALESHQASVMG